MFCTGCGRLLADGENFCCQCGRAVATESLPSPALPQPSRATDKPDAGSSIALTAIGGWLVLSVLALVFLHIYAALLAIASVAVGAVLVFSKRIRSRTKLIAAAGVIVAIVLTNRVEGHYEALRVQRESERTRNEAERRIQLAAIEQKRQDEAFKALSPEEHLQKIKALLTPRATAADVATAERHAAALPSGTTFAAEAARINAAYKEAAKRQAEADAKAQALVAKRRASEEAATKRFMRDVLAKTMEDQMLDKGYNVDIKAVGPDHTVLQIKWILVSKALAYQFSKQGDMFDSARKIGFKRIEITNGYDETWYWKLD